MIKVGIDLVEIDRLEKTIKKYGDKFLQRCYTKKELEYCFSKVRPALHLAGRFAAKEAFIKVLGKGVRFKDIEVINDEDGKPKIVYNGRKEHLASIELSISHTRNIASAVVICEER